MGKSLSRLGFYPHEPRALQIFKMVDKDFCSNNTSERRNYLGMSGIGGCPRAMYMDFLYGQAPSVERDKYGIRGYLFEKDAKKRLERIGLYYPGSEVHLVAPWDDRFAGHTDGQVPEATFGKRLLLELKSTGPEKFLKDVVTPNAPLGEHYAQVQTYMRFGGWDEALILYMNVDTYDHWPIFVARDDTVGAALEQKAKNVLAAIDRREPPRCECGWCRPRRNEARSFDAVSLPGVA